MCGNTSHEHNVHLNSSHVYLCYIISKTHKEFGMVIDLELLLVACMSLTRLVKAQLP